MNQNLIESAKNNDLPGVVIALSDGADVNFIDPTLGETALMIASFSGFLEITEQLVCAGANVELKSTLGMTALEYARKGKKSDVAKFLEQTVLSVSSNPGSWTCPLCTVFNLDSSSVCSVCGSANPLGASGG
jgi:ankyrin repeat protein